MEQKSSESVIISTTEVDFDEMKFLSDVLAFIRSCNYGEMQLTVHTDDKNIKKVTITYGRKTIYKLMNNG